MTTTVKLGDTVGWNSPLLRDMTGRVVGMRGERTALVAWDFLPGVSAPPVMGVSVTEIHVLSAEPAAR